MSSTWKDFVNIKRIAIFCFYDKGGIVDKNAEYLVKKMMSCVEKLVVVVNGSVTDEGYDLLKGYTDYVYLRENIGYDGGAYKDTILYYLKYEDWSQWDELILFNNTFYGPFYEWENVFTKMESVDVDFWGLSRCLGINTVNKHWGVLQFPEHIQSYFLVCRKSIISVPSFYEFWKAMHYANSYIDAIKNFEVAFSDFFHKKGFISTSYLEVIKPNVELEYNRMIYYDKPYHLVVNCGFPVLKKKSLTMRLFREIKAIFEYIKHNTTYDIQMILKDIERLDDEDGIKPFSLNTLENFYKIHKRIYIYGHGEWGKAITEYFEYKGWCFEGYIVTSGANVDAGEINLEEVIFEENDGIILALCEENAKQVVSKIKDRVYKHQLMIPNHVD